MKNEIICSDKKIWIDFNFLEKTLGDRLRYSIVYDRIKEV